MTRHHHYPMFLHIAGRDLTFLLLSLSFIWLTIAYPPSQSSTTVLRGLSKYQNSFMASLLQPPTAHKSTHKKTAVAYTTPQPTISQPATFSINQVAFTTKSSATTTESTKKTKAPSSTPTSTSSAPVTSTTQPTPTTPATQPAPAPAPAAPAPTYAVAQSFAGLAGVPFYTDPYGQLAIHGRDYLNTVGYDAGMERLIAQPIAKWFGNWNTNIQASVSSYVSAAAASGKTPVLVAYNIPNRDCGDYSAGGAAGAANYQAWIAGFAAGIGSRRAVVILEPDAVSARCFTAERAAMLTQAIQTLAANSRATVYLDAGNSNWLSAATEASRLAQSGIAYASGFSLNVSNFKTTESNIAYGNAVSSMVGGKHFVIDTSRNGNGPSGGLWCNPEGMALGTTPTTATASYLADAYLWVKTPGLSDGNCNVTIAGTLSPAAGVWWPEYALMLLRNAGW